MKLPKKFLKRLLPILLSLFLAAAPAALASAALPGADLSYTSDIRLFPVPLVGFVTGDTLAYSRASEFSSSIPVGRGFPVTVVGSAGQFFCVENASGDGAYILQSALSPFVPSGCEPFSVCDPNWERELCMLMLPSFMTLYQNPRADARTITLSGNTPCYVLGKTGDFYTVCNADRNVIAYILPEHLSSGLFWLTPAFR